MSYTNRDAVESWQRQETRRKHSGSVSSIGPRLISYSTPIAYKDTERKIIFIACKSYSNTTAGHKRLILGEDNLLIYPETVDYKTPEEMVKSAALVHLKYLEVISRKRDIAAHLDQYHEQRLHILKAAELYNMSPPELPSFTTTDALFTDNKALKIKIREALKDHANL